MAWLKPLEYLRERAQRGNRARFEQVLAKVPDVEPQEADRLPQASLKPPALRRSVRRPQWPNR